MNFNYFLLSIFLLISSSSAIYSAAAERSGFKFGRDYSRGFGFIEMGDPIHHPKLDLLRLIDLEGQPTFLQAWDSEQTPENRGKILIDTFNTILSPENRKQEIELIDDFVFTYKHYYKPISNNAAEIINLRIKEILEKGIDAINRIPILPLHTLQLIGLEGQPIFFKAWRAEQTPEHRGKILIYTFNSILQHKDPAVVMELIDNLEFTLKNDFKPICRNVLEIVSERIKEIKKEEIDAINRLPISPVTKLKLIGLQGQPTFYKAWKSAETPQRRGEVLIYTINNILSQVNSNERGKLIDDLEFILNYNSEPI